MAVAIDFSCAKVMPGWMEVLSFGQGFEFLARHRHVLLQIGIWYLSLGVDQCFGEKTGTMRVHAGVEKVLAEGLDQVGRLAFARAISTRSAIQLLTSDSSHPTARGPRGTGRGNVPALMW